MYPISSPIFPVSSRTMTLSLFYILAFSHIKAFPFPESTMYVPFLSLFLPTFTTILFAYSLLCLA